MKNLIYFLLLSLMAFTFTACEKDCPNPDVEEMEGVEELDPCAGDRNLLYQDWIVFENGQVIFESIVFVPKSEVAEDAIYNINSDDPEIAAADFFENRSGSHRAFQWISEDTFRDIDECALFTITCISPDEVVVERDQYSCLQVALPMVTTWIYKKD